MSEKPTDTQERIAHECKTTIVTDVATASLRAEKLKWWVEQVTEGDSGRYDLLTVADFRGLSEVVARTVAADVGVSVSLHNSEKLICLHDDPSVDSTSLMLKSISRESAGRLAVIVDGTFPVPRNKSCKRNLIVSCMDFRLHGPEGGLLEAVEEAFGIDHKDFGLLATAGGGKDLKLGDPRLSFVESQIDKGVERIIVISHTDCGKYGGNDNFTDPVHQSAVLSADLCRAVDALKLSFPAADFGIGIAHVENDRVARVEQYNRAFLR